jgi:hypothetical protein
LHSEKVTTKGSSPGFLTHLVVYAVMLVAMYHTGTPEVTGNFTERQERDFHVAAVNLAKGATPEPVSLGQIKAGKVDMSSLSFLLPQGDIKVAVPGHDFHKVTVLERHADWQLVEYRYGNGHDSVSRYRAFRDRVEPVSYRVTLDPGLLFNAIVLLIPAWIVAALINAVWNAVARRRKKPGAT